MTIESHVIPEYNTIVFVHTGRVPDDEFLAFYETFFKSSTFQPSINILVDLRETHSSVRSPEALLRFAKSMEKRLDDINESTKVAVVAPKDLSFGLARMYKVLADSVNWNFVVFRALDAALAWLGLPEDLTIHESSGSDSSTEAEL